MKQFISYLLLLHSILLSGQGNFDWAQKFGNSQLVGNSTQVCNMTNGKVLVSGEFMDNATFGTQTYTSAGEKDIFLVKMQGSTIEWSTHFGGVNDEHIQDMDFDSQHNIYLLVTFTTSIDIFGTTITSNGGQDGVLIKLSPAGELQWVKQLGGPSTDYANDIVVNHNDEILTSGKFYGSTFIDGTEITSVGSGDFYFATFASSGELLHIEQGGGSSVDDIIEIDIDADNNVLISGYFYGDITFDGVEYTTDFPTGIYIAKYNADYDFQWVRFIEGMKILNQVFVAAGAEGRVLVAGNFKGDIDFGDGYTLSTGEFDPEIYYATYSANGNVIWAKSGGGNASDEVSGIESDDNGNLYLMGFFLSGMLHFDPMDLNYTLC